MNTFTAHTLKDGIEGIRMRKTRKKSGKTSSKKERGIIELNDYFEALAQNKLELLILLGICNAKS